jgi:hypothetical protein
MRWSVGLLCALLHPVAASAHDLGIEMTFDGEIVRVEAFYDDDTPAAEAKVLVRDDSKETIAEGMTDKDGAWTFPRPAPGKYWIEVDAGAGHRRFARLTVPAKRGDAPVTDQPSRAEFTRSRLPQLLIGVAIIMAGAIGLHWFMQRRRTNVPDSTTL